MALNQDDLVLCAGAEKEREALDLRDLLRDAGALTSSSTERAATADAHVPRWYAHAGDRIDR